MTVTNPNYDRHGMKPMILKNNENMTVTSKEENIIWMKWKNARRCKTDDEKSSDKNHGGDK